MPNQTMDLCRCARQGAEIWFFTSHRIAQCRYDCGRVLGPALVGGGGSVKVKIAHGELVHNSERERGE